MTRYLVTAYLLYSGHFEADSPEEAIEKAELLGLDDYDDTLVDYQAEEEKEEDEEEEPPHA